MGIRTAIEYCDSTVNPVVGCTGCELFDPVASKNHCYAAALCRRMKGMKGWPADFQHPEHFPGRLEKAIKWPDLTGKDRPNKPWLSGKPRVIFVNDLSDGWCPDAPSADEWLASHIEAMAASPHIYLFLTKWPERLVQWVEHMEWGWDRLPANFWWGTTVTSQDTVHRIDKLFYMPGRPGNLWLSLESLLGPVDLTEWLWDGGMEYGKYNRKEYRIGAIRWVTAGGESGSNARPCHPDWARSLRDQCVEAQVPFFWKRWGDYARVKGEKKHNRTLGGREWNQVPW